MDEKESRVELPVSPPQDGPARPPFEEAENKSQNTIFGENSSLVEEEEEFFQQMMEAGVFYGRSKARTNPLMKDYVLTTRSGFEVIDLKKTIAALEEAAKFIKEAVHGNKGPILLVGTSPAAKAAVRAAAERLDLPVVTERWLGGTLTNFKVISERINQFKKFKEDRAAGKFDKYTKKEKLELDKELARLEILFGGLEKLDRLPSLLLIADVASNSLAAEEAKRVGVPVIALLNTDADPRLASCRIPANDRSPKSVQLLLNHLVEITKKAKTERGVGQKLETSLGS